MLPEQRVNKAEELVSSLSFHKYWLAPMFIGIQVSYFLCKQKMTSFRGQTSWGKMTSPKGKQTAPVCHPTKK
jgi:hypothetical protein